ncbi:MAG: alanine racemase [Phycisphaerales bacterium]|jgi:alanine racemase|nr:alanine racemase [Phycisphaerales bacterium]
MHTFQTIQHSAVQINLGAINRNCSVIRKHIGQQCQLCAVVKADGYGLGAVKVSSELSKHADLLAVYSADEAGELLVSGVGTPILVFAPVHTFDRFHPIYRGLSQGIVHLVVHDENHMRALETIASRYRITLNVQVKIDTGLHRGGCVLADAKKLIDTIRSNHHFNLTGVLTHFISATHDEELTRIQHDRFDKVLDSLNSPLSPECFLHEANTAATVQWKWSHRSMVRVGLAWTGAAPTGVKLLKDISPVVTWRSRLAHVRQVQAGEHVGYSGKWTSKRNSNIGIVPVGYAAGYPIGVGEEGNRAGAFVRVYDEQFKIPLGDAPVVGSVCMDQIAVDLTNITQLGIGCGIELLSVDRESKATLSNLAEVAGVVPHAIISRISPKVHRSYIEPSVEIVTPVRSHKHA